MTQSQFVREQLASHHNLKDFDSGESDIDSWLRESAARASARDYSRTYVWHSGDNPVIAFFALSAFGSLPRIYPEAALTENSEEFLRYY